MVGYPDIHPDMPFNTVPKLESWERYLARVFPVPQKEKDKKKKEVENRNLKNGFLDIHTPHHEKNGPVGQGDSHDD